MTARRELQIAVILCLLGSALILLSLRQSWFSAGVPDRLTIDGIRNSVTGAAIVRSGQGLALVGLAGVLALAATKGWGRVLVGLLVLVSAVGVVAEVVAVLLDGIRTRALSVAPRDLLDCGPVSDGGAFGCFGPLFEPRTEVAWVWLTLSGGVLMALGGLLVAVRGRRWAALSASYEPPVTQEQAPPVTDKGVWDALDRGDDPTT